MALFAINCSRLPSYHMKAITSQRIVTLQNSKRVSGLYKYTCIPFGEKQENYIRKTEHIKFFLYNTLKLVVELNAFLRFNFPCERQQIPQNITTTPWDLGNEGHNCEDYCL
jgi:hypothetical protein